MNPNQLFRYRLSLGLFIVGLILSGIIGALPLLYCRTLTKQTAITHG